MKIYRIKPEYMDSWSGGQYDSDDPDYDIVTEAQVRELAEEWECPLDELMEQLEENPEQRRFAVALDGPEGVIYADTLFDELPTREQVRAVVIDYITGGKTREELQKMANRGPSEPHPRRKSDSPITRLRIAKNLQQKQLAEIIGCGSQIISRWETNVSRPNRASAVKLARALDCTVSEIYGISPPGSVPAHAAAGGDNSIARLREERGMSREQLAEALGCHVSSIQHWEHGLYPPGPKYAVKLAEILGCNPDEILDKNGGTE